MVGSPDEMLMDKFQKKQADIDWIREFLWHWSDSGASPNDAAEIIVERVLDRENVSPFDLNKLLASRPALKSDWQLEQSLA